VKKVVVNLFGNSIAITEDIQYVSLDIEDVASKLSTPKIDTLFKSGIDIRTGYFGRL